MSGSSGFNRAPGGASKKRGLPPMREEDTSYEDCNELAVGGIRSPDPTRSGKMAGEEIKNRDFG